MLGLSCASPVLGRALLWVLVVTATSRLAAQQVPSEQIAPGWPDRPPTGTRQPLPDPNPLEDGVGNAAGQSIVEVRITGNESVNEDKVISLLQTRKDRQFDPEIVQKDKRNLITSGLFREVHISWQQVPGGVVVTFELLERPTIRYVTFLGDRKLGAKSLLRESGLEVGEALNVFAIQEARRKLVDLYHRSGYPNAEVAVIEGEQPGDRGVVFEISEGPYVRLWQVGFVGHHWVTASRLRAVLRRSFMNYRPGFKVNLTEVDEDIERLTAYYRRFGYFQAKISRKLEYDDSQSWLTVTFVIDEGPRYAIRNVEVLGSEKFTASNLKTQLELTRGDFFDQAKMNQDVAALRDAYQTQGYVYADINAQPRFLMDEPALDMVYQINEGNQFRVGRINVRIAGEYPHTRESVVLNRLSIKPGDIVNMREVRESERRLKLSQLFENNAAEGKTPKIVIRPPQLDDVEELIGRRPRSSVRGQSPDGTARRHSVRRMDLDVYVPPLQRNPQQGNGRR